LDSANLTGAILTDAKLSYADVRRSTMTSANLNGTKLSETNLSYANLRRAHLMNSDLSGESLYGADLTGADLRGAILSDADFISAKVERTRFNDPRWFSRETKRDLMQRGAIFEA
ncbi:MAG: transcriptional regulator, XRE family protein, partial [Leptolyngbya sp. ERB_1_2]